MAEFHFIRPYCLLALIPALTLFILLLRHKLNSGNWNTVCDPELLPFLLQEKPSQQNNAPLIGAILATLLTILAMAGPTWERIPAPAFRNEAALVIALDLSRSMDANDIKPSRLSRARYKIADILQQRKDGQTALLAYAGDAFVVTPLTQDTETIASQLQALSTDIMPAQGSDTVSAIQSAIRLLKQTGLQEGHILLISDDIDDQITDLAKKILGRYQLSVLGVGAPEGAPIPGKQGGFVKDAEGNIVVPKLDAAKLSALAQAGRGHYQTVSANDNDIDYLLSKLDSPLSDAENAENPLYMDIWAEKGPWLLLAALPLVALSFRKGLLSLAFLILLPFPQDSYALSWNDLWQTDDQQAQQAWRQQDYSAAAEKFQNPDWKAAAQFKAGQYQQAAETLAESTSADGQYNRGNALAKAGQLQQALDAYQQALTINPEHQDALHNKQQVEKLLQEQQQQQQENQSSEQGDQQQSPEDGQPSEDQSSNSEQSQSSESQSSEDRNAQQNSDQNQQAEQQAQDASENEPENAQEQHNQAQAEESEEQSEDQTEASASQAIESSDENQQASEQWLNRIPDNPSGLLKRKFQYQYKQRGQSRQQNKQW